MDRIHISLYAEDPVAGAGIRALLERVPEVEIHDASDELETIVLVVCADLVDHRTLTALRRWGSGSAVRIVLVAGDIREAQVLDVIGCGVCAVLRRREVTTDRLVQTIKVVAAGQAELPADLVGGLLAQIGRARRGGAGAVAGSALSPQEIDVIKLVAAGFEAREIAEKLSCSRRTVDRVLREMMLRLDLRTRPHAVAYAAKGGFLC